MASSGAIAAGVILGAAAAAGITTAILAAGRWGPFSPEGLHEPGTRGAGVFPAITAWRTAGYNDSQFLSRYLARNIIRYGTPPANSRIVPIVGRTRTHVATMERPANYYRNAAWIANYLDGCRAALNSAGRGDEDARISQHLWIRETGWDNAVWNNNYGNIKSGNTLYAPSREWVLSNLQVYTTAQYSSGVYLLQDNANSLDMYHSYADASAYAIREKALFQWSNYSDALDGSRQGEMAGDIRFSRALAFGGYSGPGDIINNTHRAVQWEAECRWHWGRMPALLGDAWRR